MHLIIPTLFSLSSVECPDSKCFWYACYCSTSLKSRTRWSHLSVSCQRWLLQLRACTCNTAAVSHLNLYLWYFKAVSQQHAPTVKLQTLVVQLLFDRKLIRLPFIIRHIASHCQIQHLLAPTAISSPLFILTAFCESTSICFVSLWQFCK